MTAPRPIFGPARRAVAAFVRGGFGLIAAALLSACSAAPIEPPLPPLTGEWRIIPVAEAPKILMQCSRNVPPATATTDFFVPTEADIARMEAALSAWLTSNRYFIDEAPIIRGNFAANGMVTAAAADQLAVTLTSGWAREYAGIERDGRRSIYGNYVMRSPPLPVGTPLSLAPSDVCDGGPSFFGAEFSLDSRTLTHVAFNGPPPIRQGLNP
jgi:hypothetical protein